VDPILKLTDNYILTDTFLTPPLAIQTGKDDTGERAWVPSYELY